MWFTFDSNVTIQGGCDYGRNHGEDIASSLKVVWTNSKVAGIDSVLSLIVIHEEAVEHVPEESH